jgi:hypothetical protein
LYQERAEAITLRATPMPTADIRNAMARFTHANQLNRCHAFASGFAIAGFTLPVLRVAEGTLWIAFYCEDGGRVGAVRLANGLERFVIPEPQHFPPSGLHSTSLATLVQEFFHARSVAQADVGIQVAAALV